MKIQLYILTLLILMGCFSACDRSDEGDLVTVAGANSLPNVTDLDKRVLEMYEKYGVIFKFDFPESEFTYDWTTTLSAVPYTKANEDYGIMVLDSIEEWVFKVFPDGFIKKNLQLNIMMVDSLKVEYLEEDYETGESNTSYNSIPGMVTKNYVAIGNVGPNFQQLAPNLKLPLISLFVERIMMNTANCPYPTEFQEMSGTIGGIRGCYWTGDYSYFDSWWGSYPLNNPLEYFQWWEVGILNAGIIGVTNYYSMGAYGDGYMYAKGTVYQDFGDYVALLLTKTDTEVEAYLTYVKDRMDNIQFSDGAAGVAIMRDKIAYVKNYCQKVFGMTL